MKPSGCWQLLVFVFASFAMTVVPPSAFGRAPTGRWLDWQQQSRFGIDGDTYACVITTDPAKIAALTIGNVAIAQGRGIVLSAVTDTGPLSVGNNVKPNWQVFEHQRFVPARSAHARVNVWSCGPYFWDTRVLDIPLMKDAASPPVRGAIQFSAQPDSLRITATATPEHGERLQSLAWQIDDDALEKRMIGNREFLCKTGDQGAAWLLLPPGSTWNTTDRTLRMPTPNAGTIVIRWIGNGEKPEHAFADDLSPLSAERFDLKGGQSVGFDTANGVYVLRSTATRDAFSFEESFRNPARRMEMGITARPGWPRRVLIKAESGIGNLEAGVVADANGFPLPIPVQVSKNFAGEKEEPDDTAFGDAYFPLDLSEDQTEPVRLFLLTQNWGLSPLKQVSSVRFFNVYWHLSTGASESTCYTHAWMDARFRGARQPTFLLIPDFRPMSGPMWPGQPQHGCDQFPGLLQYNDDVRLVYDRTDFESISPLFARFTMQFHTSDDAATASVQVMEVPQTDEMRTFMRVRYAWHKPARINGDARLNFRLANLFEHYTPDAIVWCDEKEQSQQRAPKTDDSPTLLGEPLAKVGPVVGSYHNALPDRPQRNSALLLVRTYRGQLAGETVQGLAATSRFTDKCGSSWLTLPKPKLELRPGDWIEMDLEFMPNGEPTPAWLKPKRERDQFAAGNRPTVGDVSLGSKIDDFPATLKADRGAATFTIAGGQNAAPVLIRNWPAKAIPLVWLNGKLLDRQLSGGDYYQIEPSADGGLQIALALPIRDGQTLPLMITAAQCPSGIRSVERSNGRLRVRTPNAATLTIESPRPLGPGTNVYDPARRLWQFTGTTGVADELPLLFKPQGAITLHCDQWGEKGGTVATDAPVTVQLEPAMAEAGWTIRLDRTGQSGKSVDLLAGDQAKVSPGE